PEKKQAKHAPRPGMAEYEASPDGKLAAFVRKDPAVKGSQNLVVGDAERDGKAEWQVTTSAPGMLYGVLDWVSQEEVYGRGKFKGFWWSPDSKFIAFLGLSENEVKDFATVDHIPDQADLDKDKTVKVE